MVSVKSSYDKEYYINNKEKFAIASKKYSSSDKGKATTKKYRESESGGEAYRRSTKKYRESESGKEMIRKGNKKYQRKKRNNNNEKIQKMAENGELPKTKVNRLNEILPGSYKYPNRPWSLYEEKILREGIRRGPDKVRKTWKQIGIILNRPQKQVRTKWRSMIEKR